MVTGNQNFSEYFLETQNLFFFLVGNHFYQNLFIKVLNLAERTLKDLQVFAWKLPKSHRKIQNYGNHPTFYDTEHFQKAVYKNNTR